MNWGYVIAGAILGGLLGSQGDSSFLGLIGGGVVAWLLARLAMLDQRVRELEAARRLQRSQRTAAASRDEPSPEPPFETEPEFEPEPDFEPAASEAAALPEAGGAIRAWDEATPAMQDAAEAPPSDQPPESPRGWPPPAESGPAILDVLLDRARTWLTTGNIPVKVGVIISFIGVSFLLKYAIDRRVLVIPLEARLLAVAAAGLALAIIGWRLRERMRVYALSLQGGGIGVLFLTIFAAFRVWALLPAPLAFVLLVVLTASAGALSVLQNSRSLAILGVVGGFLAPVLTSTGQGSHVALFSYYLVLNGAILGIAWFRAWRELNLVGFVFTFVIGSFWGYQFYRPELWTSTQPFLVLYFLFYQAIAILYTLRQPPQRADLIDGTLVFGTPVIAFALQYALVGDTEYGLAISAAAAAVFYALTATWLFRQETIRMSLLVEAYMALAVAFATLAIPLALDARWTSAAWALEGAALVWVGARQNRQLAKLAGVTLILFSGVAFLNHGWQSGAGLPVLNGNVLGGLLISLSAFFASRRLERTEQTGLERVHRRVSLVLFLWAALWWLVTGWMETTDRLPVGLELPVLLLFSGASSGAAVWLGRARGWELLRNSAIVLLPLLTLLALIYYSENRHFLLGLGWLAWPLAWGAQAYVLRSMDESEEPLAGIWHVLSLLGLTLLLALEVFWWTGRVASDAWAAAAASLAVGVMALLVWRFRQRPDWPVPAHPALYRIASLLLVSGQVLYLAVLCVAFPGDPSPWPYLPVLNPFDLAMIFAMLTAFLSVTVLQRDSDSFTASVIESPTGLYRPMLAGAFFLMTTAALVRGVHHYSSVPWDFDALFASVVVQTALSIYWGLLGFAGMIWGARKKRRAVWLAGAGFMALVVIKLFLVDLGNTGTVERIVSFIGIGALLLVVGYFAPAPPRHPKGDSGDRAAP